MDHVEEDSTHGRVGRKGGRTQDTHRLGAGTERILAAAEQATRGCPGGASGSGGPEGQWIPWGQQGLGYPKGKWGVQGEKVRGRVWGMTRVKAELVIVGAITISMPEWVMGGNN